MLYAAMRPVLDLMQTLPTFVYLTPPSLLFGLGVVPGLISTIIFAAGAHSADAARHLVRAHDAARGRAGFRATPLQLLLKAELRQRGADHSRRDHAMHHAEPLDGRHRCIGRRGGLACQWCARSTPCRWAWVEAGIAIVLLAIILDRISRR